jgi:hypothetical protein
VGATRVTLINYHDPAFEAELLTRIDKLFKKPIADAEWCFCASTCPKISSACAGCA